MSMYFLCFFGVGVFTGCVISIFISIAYGIFRPAESMLYGKPAVPRSPHWPTVRKDWLADHPNCEACGGTKDVEVHHIEPFHLHPEKELDRSNFITLCEHSPQNCHYHYGHNALSWSSYNTFVRTDAARFLERRKQGEVK